MEIKYSIIIKEWFDRVNGNSYCAVRITDNTSGEEFALPFEYGYGSYGEQRATVFLKDYGEEFDYLREIASTTKIDGCLKRDVKEWGIG